MSAPYARIGDDVLYVGDCREMVPLVVEPESVDAIVTDPPYELTQTKRRKPAPYVEGSPYSRHRVGVNGDNRPQGGFMGKEWDGTGVAFGVRTWQAAFAALKPGGHLVAFGGTRTVHRMTCAIEDAGFEIRDTLTWLYGSGFPKSLDVSKAVDRAVGAAREQVRPRSVIAHQRSIGNTRPYMNDPDHLTDSDTPASDDARRWEGWGTALKPCHEPIVLARKPLSGTVAATVLEHGTGALNIDGCRIGSDDTTRHNRASIGYGGSSGPFTSGGVGRWPGNVLLGCACDEEHEPDCAVRLLDEQSGELTYGVLKAGTVREGIGYRGGLGNVVRNSFGADSGGASRFFKVVKWTTDDARSVEANSSQPSAPDDSAQSTAATAHASAQSERGLGSTDGSPSCTLSLNPASGADPRVSTDTTPTMETCCALCGSALPATAASIRPGNGDEVEGDSAPALGTRFLYSAKASRAERTACGRVDNPHATVKPLALMRWLVRLVAPPGGRVLDPFTGSGTTWLACQSEGMAFTGFELLEEHAAIIVARAREHVGSLFAEAPEPPPADATRAQAPTPPSLFDDEAA